MKSVFCVLLLVVVVFAQSSYAVGLDRLTSPKFLTVDIGDHVTTIQVSRLVKGLLDKSEVLKTDSRDRDYSLVCKEQSVWFIGNRGKLIQLKRQPIVVSRIISDIHRILAVSKSHIWVLRRFMNRGNLLGACAMGEEDNRSLGLNVEYWICCIDRLSGRLAPIQKLENDFVLGGIEEQIALSPDGLRLAKVKLGVVFIKSMVDGTEYRLVNANPVPQNPASSSWGRPLMWTSSKHLVIIDKSKNDSTSIRMRICDVESKRVLRIAELKSPVYGGRIRANAKVEWRSNGWKVDYPIYKQAVSKVVCDTGTRWVLDVDLNDLRYKPAVVECLVRKADRRYSIESVEYGKSSSSLSIPFQRIDVVKDGKYMLYRRYGKRGDIRQHVVGIRDRDTHLVREFNAAFAPECAICWLD